MLLPYRLAQKGVAMANLQIGVKPQNEKFTLDALVLKTGMANRPAKELVLQI